MGCGDCGVEWVTWFVNYVKGGGQMFLYVAFDDTWNAWHCAQMGLDAPTAHRRIKKIRLTPEQIKELQPREVGKSGYDIQYEQVSVLCLQND